MDAHTGMMSTIVYGLSLIQHLHTHTQTNRDFVRNAEVGQQHRIPTFYNKTGEIQDVLVLLGLYLSGTKHTCPRHILYNIFIFEVSERVKVTM